MSDRILQETVRAFNNRSYREAARFSAEGLTQAQGRDEAFWMGLNEACEGYFLLSKDETVKAEGKLVASMEKLRSFGFRYNSFEVTAALAGIRRTVEEIRAVRTNRRKVFDVSLVSQFRMADKAVD